MTVVLLSVEATAPLWLYGIRRAGEAAPFDAEPLPGGGAIGVVPAGEVELLAGAAPEGEVRRTRRNMLAHARALEAAAAAAAVLPMRFGAIHTASEAVAAAQAREVELRGRLDELEGLGEFGLRISWPEEAVYAALAAAHPELARRRQEIARNGPGAREAMIDLGRRVSEAMSTRRGAAQKSLLNSLRPLTADHRLRAPESEFEALRMEVLLRRRDENAFLDAVAAAAERAAYAAGAPAIRWVGPSAPFNFVDIALEPARKG